MTFLTILLMFSFCGLRFHTEACVPVYFLLLAQVFEQSIAASWEWQGTANQNSSAHPKL